MLRIYSVLRPGSYGKIIVKPHIPQIAKAAVPDVSVVSDVPESPCPSLIHLHIIILCVMIL